MMDEVKTLFVSGLPSDVKQRELHLLFRPYKGETSYRVLELMHNKLITQFIITYKAKSSDRETELHVI